MPPRRRVPGSRNVATSSAQRQTWTAMQQAHVATRDGFPWPPDVELFHATAAADRIRREGFRTRKTGAAVALGGAHANSVSFTLSAKRAAAIALGLDILIRGAKRELSLASLAKSLARECPKGIREGLTSGYNLQDAVEDLRDPLRSLLPVFEALDDGWRWFHAYSAVDVSPAKGARRFGRANWLLPPWADDPPEGNSRASVPTGSTAGVEQLFFETYKSVVRSGDHTEECFNPIWMGTDMRALATLSTDGVGIVIARSGVPRVCSDARGLVRLGYFDLADFEGRHLRWPARSYHEALDGWGRACVTRLGHGLDKDDDAYDNHILKARVRDLLANSGWSGNDKDAAPGGWVPRQQGRVGAEDSMFFHAGEEEVRVYAPRAIEVLDVLPMDEVRFRHGLLGTGRTTYPYFDADAIDVAVWPPGRKRRR